MPTPRETILTALHARLQTLAAPVLRGDVLPERIPASGLIIQRDGKPGDPEVTLSPLTFFYEHRAELEVVIQAGIGRDAQFDALTADIGAAIATDRTVGGLCDWVDAKAPEPVDLPIEGAAPLKAAVIAVLRHPRPADLIFHMKGHRHGTRTRSAGADGACVRDGLRHPAGVWLYPDALHHQFARGRATAPGLGTSGLWPRSPRALAGCDHHRWMVRC